jgi:hypothetical protein
VSYSSRAPPPLRTVDEVDHAVEAPRSLLYLEIGAVAAYYTPDKYRMENPDSVGVEISSYSHGYHAPEAIATNS